MDPNKGLFNKYKIERVDGKNDGVNVGRGHVEPADYFILKLNSGNKYEIEALEAYARSCKNDLPLLSRDLFEKAAHYRKRFNY